MGPYAFDRELLHHAQELGLGRRGEIGDLVEEDGPFVRQLELARAPPYPGGGPILNAEQLRLDQRVDDRRAVDGDERPSAAGALLVDLSGDELLARAALAFYQYREVGRRHLDDLMAQSRHARGTTNQRRRWCGRLHAAASL